MVFDLPSSKQPYEIRMIDLNKLNLPSTVHVLKAEKCTGMKHLEEYLDSVIKQGGEGLMVNKSDSLYSAGKTTSLLKVKVNFLLFIYLTILRDSKTQKFS